MWQKLDCDLDDFAGNQATFITFNYDRSLEHFLFEAMLHRYGDHKNSLYRERVVRAFRTIRIVHVYGHVGLPVWATNGDNTAPYGAPLDIDRVTCAAATIKIMAEGRDDSEELKRALAFIKPAQQVFFVGFGYHDENMRRIGFPYQSSGPATRPPFYVAGSGYGLSDPERRFIKATRLGLSHEAEGGIGDAKHTNTDFLKNDARFVGLE